MSATKTHTADAETARRSRLGSPGRRSRRRGPPRCGGAAEGLVCRPHRACPGLQATGVAEEQRAGLRPGEGRDRARRRRRGAGLGDHHCTSASNPATSATSLTGSSRRCAASSAATPRRSERRRHTGPQWLLEDVSPLVATLLAVANEPAFGVVGIHGGVRAGRIQHAHAVFG